ncbi:hypothetical protein QAD02_000343 [Eretmocerus hayati]|uniref:Uncharacterized protein n=1 Tax=Eretmocerus hayati TaxID=131215 RepID=A0ACC2ND31_9HYME|nr:hypothetical protein QAD02_000343 [Eretmocerus hayati]
MMGSPPDTIESSKHLNLNASSIQESSKVSIESESLISSIITSELDSQSSKTEIKEVEKLSTSTKRPEVPKSTTKKVIPTTKATKKPSTPRPKPKTQAPKAKNTQSSPAKIKPTTPRTPKTESHPKSTIAPLVAPYKNDWIPIIQPPRIMAKSEEGYCIGSCPRGYSNPVLFLPHLNCNKFCQCNFGKPIVRSCGEGLYFNSRLWVCDYPANTDCRPIHAPTTFHDPNAPFGIDH